MLVALMGRSGRATALAALLLEEKGSDCDPVPRGETPWHNRSGSAAESYARRAASEQGRAGCSPSEAGWNNNNERAELEVNMEPDKCFNNGKG